MDTFQFLKHKNVLYLKDVLWQSGAYEFCITVMSKLKFKISRTNKQNKKW